MFQNIEKAVKIANSIKEGWDTLSADEKTARIATVEQYLSHVPAISEWLTPIIEEFKSQIIAA